MAKAMKVNQIVCPKCKSSLTSKAGIEEGTSINCPKCKNKFAVASPDQEEVYEDFDVVDDDEEETPKKSAAKSTLKPLSKQRKAEPEEDEDDNEEETPKKSAAKSTLKPLSKKRKAQESVESLWQSRCGRRRGQACRQEEAAG